MSRVRVPLSAPILKESRREAEPSHHRPDFLHRVLRCRRRGDDGRLAKVCHPRDRGIGGLWRIAAYPLYAIDRFFDRLSEEVAKIDDERRAIRRRKEVEELDKLDPDELEREGQLLLAALVRGRRRLSAKSSGEK